MSYSSLPTVTCIISTFNRSQYLAESLDSVLAQTVPLSQLIVINDGSEDATASILERYADKAICLNQPNQGKAAAINSVLDRVTGEYVWIFDDDDYAFPDMLQKSLAALVTAPESKRAFSYGWYLVGYDGPDKRLVHGEPRSLPNVDDDDLLCRLLQCCFLVTAAMLIRTDLLREDGGLDARLIRSQDYDLFVRLMRHHRGVQVKDGPLFVRRMHDGIRGSKNDRIDAVEMDRRWAGYEQIVLEKVFRNFALREFLPVSQQVTPLTSLSERTARINRFVILALRGMWREAFAELALVQQLMHLGPLSEAERGAIRQCGQWVVIEELVGSRHRLWTWIRHLVRVAAPLRKEILRGVSYASVRNGGKTAMVIAVLKAMVRGESISVARPVSRL